MKLHPGAIFLIITVLCMHYVVEVRPVLHCLGVTFVLGRVYRNFALKFSNARARLSGGSLRS